MTMLDIFGALLILIMMGSVWLLICNYRTYRQRMRIIDWIYSDDQHWRERNRAYDEVSYDQHLFALMMFYNPRKLYNFKETD